MRTITRGVMRLAIGATAAVLLGCGDATGVDIGGVTATVKHGRIDILNGTAKPIFTFIVGRQMSALADWIPCADPRYCESIEPGGRRTVDWPPPYDGTPETEAIVYWWHSVATPNGYGPDSIRVGIVRLNPLFP